MSSLIVAKTQPWVLALHGQQTVFVTSWTGTACAAKGCGDVAWKSIRWARCRGRFKELKLEAKKKKKWWWWLFPHLQEFLENVRSFIPCLHFFFLKWRLAHMHYFHSLCEDQSTVAQWVEMTVAECSMTSCMWACFQIGSHAMPVQRHS